MTLSSRDEVAPRKRPVRVTLLAGVVLTFTALYWVRFGAAVTSWRTIRQFTPEWLPWYLLVSGLVWGIVGLLVLWGLWRGRPAARVGTIGVAVVFGMYYWLDRIFIANPHTWHYRILFSLGLTALLLFLVYLGVGTPGAKDWFQQTANPEGENTLRRE